MGEKKEITIRNSTAEFLIFEKQSGADTFVMSNIRKG